MKKRIFAMIVLVLAVTFAVPAEAITAEGSGATREEAILSAKQNLSAYLSVSISSTQSSMMKDDGKKIDSSYAEDITAESSVRLFGVKTSTPVEKKGVWTCTASIAESEKSMYLSEINRIRPFLEKIDMNKTGSAEEVIEYYSQALWLYVDFELYSRVYTRLTDGESQIPALPISKSEITARYNTLLKSFGNTLDYEDYFLQEKAKKGQLTEAEQERKAEIRAEKDALQAKMDAFLAQQDEEKRALEKAADARTREYLEKLSGVKFEKPKVDIADPVKFILGIEEYRNIFSDAKRALTIDLDKEWYEFEEAAEKRAREIMSAKSMKNSALVDSDGVPTAEYFELQMDRVLVPEIEKLYRVYYENAWKMYDATMDSYRDILDEARENLTILNGTSFTASRFTGEVNPTVRYEVKRDAWAGTAYLVIAGQEVSVPFEIPFEKLTGVSPDIDFLEFGLELEAWHNILISSDLAYDVSVTYHIEGSLSSNEYKIVIDSITVSNPLETAEKSTLYSREGNVKTQRFTLTENNLSMTSFKTDNRFGITSMMPAYTPLGLMPKSTFVAPEIPELVKAVRPDEAELPRGKRTEVRKEIYSTAGQAKSFGLNLGGSQAWTGKATDSLFTFGASWKTKMPVFADTRFRADGGVAFQTDFKESCGVGAYASLDFMSYVNSLTYVIWGIGAESMWTIGGGDIMVTPEFILGFGGETGAVDADVAGFIGCRMESGNAWQAELAGGFRFRLSWLLL